MMLPGFWQKNNAFVRTLLMPCVFLYNFLRFLDRKISTVKKAPIPVICVGNLVVGGAGKTPLTLALVQQLRDLGITAHVVTRGYGGCEKGPLRVDLQRHTVRDVGDEALLLAQHATTWISRRRADAVSGAVGEGAQVLILDDGFQHYSLAHDLSFIVVDGRYGFGNENVMPAGPLRESLREGMKRAHAMVIVGEDIYDLYHRFHRQIPVLKAEFQGDQDKILSLREDRFFAFAGIGLPQKFFDFLTHHRIQVVRTKAFKDHYPYGLKDMENLIEKASQEGLRLMTTYKDWVRIPPLYQKEVTVLEVDLVLNPGDQIRLRALLNSVLNP